MTYRGLVDISSKASNSSNYTQCDSLLIGDKCGAHTVPYIEVKNNTARVEHEATTSKVDDDQLFYCRQRGLSEEDAVSMLVNGFCKDVFKELPRDRREFMPGVPEEYWPMKHRFMDLDIGIAPLIDDNFNKHKYVYTSQN